MGSLARVLLAGLTVVALAGCGADEVAIAPEPRAPVEAPRPPPPPPGSFPSWPVECGDPAPLRAAIALALADARASAGVAEEHLEGCDSAIPVCLAGGPGFHVPPDPPATPPDRCSVLVAVGLPLYQMHFVPRARDGAPASVASAVTLDAPPTERTSTIVEASTWGVSSDRAVLGIGIAEQTSYTHGGPPATISGARMRITNASDAAITLQLRRVEWLGARARELGSLAIEPSVIAARATVDVDVGFEAQTAFVTYSAPAASRATIDAGGREIAVVIEHRIVSRTPRAL